MGGIITMSRVILFLIICFILPYSQIYSQFIALDTLSQGWVTSVLIKENKIILGAAFTGNWYDGGGIYSSLDNGLTWQLLATLTTAPTCLANNGQLIFAGTYGSGVFVSTNDGINWHQSNLMNTHVHALSIIDDYIFAATASGVFFTTNVDSVWSLSNVGLANSKLHVLLYYGNVLYGGAYRYSTGDEGVFYSSNMGASWHSLGTNIPPVTISGLAIVEDELFCSAWTIDPPYQFYGVLHFSTSDSTWVPVNEGLYILNVTCLISDSINLFAGTTISPNYSPTIFHSDNLGINWRSVGEGLNSSSISSIAVNDEFIFVGDRDGTIWRRPLEEITAVQNHMTDRPDQFELFQNYPNPFNPRTTISFTIPTELNVELKVYDVLGNEIKTLLNGYIEAGRHQVVFNGNNLSSGLYFYQLKTAYFLQTKKLLLVK
jgi:hypothetical protein